MTEIKNERAIALRQAKKWQHGNPRSNGDGRPMLEVERDWMALCFVCEVEAREKAEAQLEKTKQDMHLVVSDAGKGLIAERDSLRQQLAERDSEIKRHGDELNGRFHWEDPAREAINRANQLAKKALEG